MAKAGISSTPSSPATSPMAVTSSSIAASCGPCSRLPYVDSTIDVVGVGERSRVADDRRVVAAEVAGEDEGLRRAAIGHAQLDDRRAEDVARVVEDGGDAVGDGHLGAVVAADRQRHRLVDVVVVVQRLADLGACPRAGRGADARGGSRRPSRRRPQPPRTRPRPRPPSALRAWWRFQRSANSTWSFAESRRTISARSTVALVAWIGPVYPARVRAGIRPQWSRWAWVSRSASSVCGSKANGIRLRAVSSGEPWNIPQSTSTRRSPTVSEELRAGDAAGGTEELDADRHVGRVSQELDRAVRIIGAHVPAVRPAARADAGQADSRRSRPETAGPTSRSGTASAPSSSAMGRSVFIQSRDRKPLNRYFPELEEPLLALGGPDARFVVDGEVVIARPGGGLDFDSLLIRIHPAESRVRMLAAATPASFVAFDCLADGDDDLRDRPFAERRARLERLAEGPAGIGPSHAVHLGSGDRPPLVRRLRGRRAGWRGREARRLALRARQADDGEDQARAHRRLRGGRLPLAQERAGDADRLAAARPLERGRAAPARRRHVLVHDGQAARSWSSSSSRTAAAPWTTTRGASGRWPRPPRSSRAAACRARRRAGTAARTCRWEPLRPELVCEVAFDHLQGDRFRHAATFQRWRPDRSPADCRYDQLEETPPALLADLFGS